MRDRAAIAGVGATPYSKNSGVSTLTLALRAIRAALDDAGLTIADVDGVACHRVGDSAQAVIVAQSLGIRDLRYHLDLFAGGSGSHQVLMHAAMAVATGAAEVVVGWRAINARSEFRMGGTGRAAPDTLEFQYQVPYGYATPPQQFAMYARAYMDEYGVTAEDLGAVAISAAQLRGTQRAGDDAHPADDGRLPRVALDRRAVPALRLLPRDRRRASRSSSRRPNGRATSAGRRC